jgi:hypothetical protein
VETPEEDLSHSIHSDLGAFTEMTRLGWTPKLSSWAWAGGVVQGLPLVCLAVGRSGQPPLGTALLIQTSFDEGIYRWVTFYKA